MLTKCYVVEFNSALEGLFDKLEECGFNWYNYRESSTPGYIEIGVWCYSFQIRDLENIFAPYV